jgi:alkaline phosphatase
LYWFGREAEAINRFLFCRHTEVFSGMSYSINDRTVDGHPILTVKKGKHTLVVRDDSNVVLLNGQEKKLQTVVVYVDKNKTFYLPAGLAGWL